MMDGGEMIVELTRKSFEDMVSALKKSRTGGKSGRQIVAEMSPILPKIVNLDYRDPFQDEEWDNLFSTSTCEPELEKAPGTIAEEFIRAASVEDGDLARAMRILYGEDNE